MALIDDFKARFPEFTDAIVDVYIPILEPVWPCYFNKDYTVACNQEAILNLVAHLITLETQGGAAASQLVGSKSVGSVSVSYVAPTASLNMYSSTKYGQRFNMLTSAMYGGCAL